MRPILLMTGVTALVLFVLAIPARHAIGDEQAVFATVSAVICLLPAICTLLISARLGKTSPQAQLYAVLVGSLVRMGIVLAAAVILYQNVAYFQGQDAFLYWLLLFYLVTLALEKALVFAARTTTSDLTPSSAAGAR